MASAVFVLAATATAAFSPAAKADDDNSKLDELGTIPRLRAKFDGNTDPCGEEKCVWTGMKAASFVKSREGKAVVCGEGKGYAATSSLGLGSEWTIVTVAKAPAGDGEKFIWTLGSGSGKGAKAMGLATNGKGGVKLVSWETGAGANTVLAMRNVAHADKQFHMYAVTKADSGPVTLWIDGKKAGSSDKFDSEGLGDAFRIGAFAHSGEAGGIKPADAVAMDDFRVYDTALSEVQVLQIANGNAPWPTGLPMPKESISAFIDTNAVLRLGYEIPENITIGQGGEKRLYAKGVLAQCGIGGEKSFKINPGGQFALGSGALVFDSNYAKATTNLIEFAGGTLLAFEPTYIKSAAPIKLTGSMRFIANNPLAIRASFEGDGNIVKAGNATLGLQYPCDNATGKLTIANPCTVVFGPAATWGGTLELCKGAILKCVSKNQIKHLVAPPGSKVLENAPATQYGQNAFPQPATGYNLKKMQKERMGRGVFAVRQTPTEVMVGWRYKSSDPTNLAFNVYANGSKLNSSPIKDVTYFKTKWTGKKTQYEVRGVLNGKEGSFRTSASWTLPADAPVGYFDIELVPPPDTRMPDGSLSKHIPYDCSVGDLDGDGEYDLVIIWWPDNGGDNASWHKTGDTWIEGVKLDGTNRSLWKINLGPNIRSGSHYVPVMVCDMDGDGKAEVVCRTADGTVDAKGNVIGDAKTDWRRIIPGAHILWAHNFTTVFDGATGVAIDSVPFKPDVLSDETLRAEGEAQARTGADSRAMRKWELAINREWSSRNPGNQAFRMLSAVAYLDGVHPSVVMCRGYYSRTCLCAYDFDGRKLRERWYFCSDDQRWWGYGGQGFHNLRVGDVDFDGKDEIIYGHMVVDHDGRGLYTTGMGHGDAMHLIQASPETRGLQVWTCHEAAPYGVSLFDAQSGRLHFWKHGPQDTGSCNALDADADAPGVELFSGCHCGIYSASTGEEHMHPRPRPQDNYYGMLRFGIWWKGDMTRSAYSGGTQIKQYSVKGREVSYISDLTPGEVHSNHSTKGCPALVADLFGDWREEILLTRNDDKAIRVFMSPFDTPYRFHTFMEDPVYRISVLTQNNGYNVPTDPGFYFGPELLGHGIWFRGTFLK